MCLLSSDIISTPAYFIVPQPSNNADSKPSIGEGNSSEYLTSEEMSEYTFTDCNSSVPL